MHGLHLFLQPPSSPPLHVPASMVFSLILDLSNGPRTEASQPEDRINMLPSNYSIECLGQSYGKLINTESVFNWLFRVTCVRGSHIASSLEGCPRLTDAAAMEGRGLRYIGQERLYMHKPRF